MQPSYRGVGAMSSMGSITQWIESLGRGERREEAARALVDRYYDGIVRYSSRWLRLHRVPPSVADGQDAALDAFAKVCRGIEGGRLRLASRADLRRVLQWSARCALINGLDRHPPAPGGGRPHRGPHEERRPAASPDAEMDSAGEGSLWENSEEYRRKAKKYRPDLLSEAEDACRKLLSLLDKVLRPIALLKFAGFTNQQIADELHLARATIERRLMEIRKKLAEFAPEGPAKPGRRDASDGEGATCDVGGTTTILDCFNGLH
jgi:RNA polymerase sigma factor (sigma-70 family)